MKPSHILNKDEIQKPRSVEELDLWLKDICDAFHSTTEGIQYFRFRKGLTKQIAEEVIPLARFAKLKYGLSSGVKIMPVLGNQKFDGIIIDGDNKNKIETTLAFDGFQEHHRMKILTQNKSVSAWGNIDVKGSNHRGHDYQVENQSINDKSIYGQIINYVTIAHSKKIAMDYKDVDTLVIAFEDFLKFTEPEDQDTFITMLNDVNFPSTNTFKSIWVIGLSGKIGFEMHAN